MMMHAINKPVLMMMIFCISFLMLPEVDAQAESKAKKVNWESLNLSPDQTKNINQYEYEWENTYTQVAPEIDHDKQDLMRELGAPNPDHGRVMQLQNRISQNKQRLQNTSMSVYLKKKQQLNDDQKDKLKRMMFERSR